MTPVTDASARESTREVGAWAAALRWDEVPEPVRARVHLVLLDSLGVTLVGARLPEHGELTDAWRPGPGPVPLVGRGRTTSVETAAWLNATAMVRLELDEGNKFAAGHPAAHGFWAVLALACDLGSSGPDTAASLLVAYEVASRYGRATRLRAGLHPHGNWGVTGAAAGCARLLGLSADQVAGAIDTGAGMAMAGPFDSAVDGHEVRNAWMGASNVSGLAAARLSAAGGARCTGTAAASLGGILGTFDASALTLDLGTRWDVMSGYFKRHAACSFTHPVADALLDLRQSAALSSGTVESVLVETHGLAAGLDRQTWDGRLSALFSIPFVAATALVHGQVGPRESAPTALDDPRVAEVAARVRVIEAPDLTARLPRERAARVTVRTTSEPGGRTGTEHIAMVTNPVGDADHHPLDEADVMQLLAAWVDDDAALAVVSRVAGDLAEAPDVKTLINELAL